ncbi:hypothetical protein WJX73_000196 [Symbiochloris irregularis]|uniref:Geranylgeranyl transferase type-2 subunit alpha n=1 Tax=Symbiochloris irregularis TaxID=706552 RepID=A0AAW1P6K3_9CHLO
MHNRPRPPKGLPEDPKAVEAGRVRLQKLSRVCNEVLKRVAEDRVDEESLKLAAALLEQNPECYSVWNYRRRAFQAVLQGRDGSAAAREAADAELALTERCLRRNPKSYATWHHRRWIIQKGLTPLKHELQLLGQLLEVDSRNFMAWAYRRFIVALAGIPPRDEEQYAAGLIDANFSNYSAWHARTTLLHAVHSGPPVMSVSQLVAGDQAAGAGSEHNGSGQPSSAGASAELVPLAALRQEFELVHQACFTDPEDQSAWLNHRWLLARTFAHTQGPQTSAADEGSPAHQDLTEIFEQEVDMCNQLLEVEPDRTKCKWPLLTLARLQEMQQQLGLRAGSQGSTQQSAADIYRELMVVDPKRKGYYADALEGRAHVMAV